MHFLPGFFAYSLPGPVERLSLLRVDADLFVPILEVCSFTYTCVFPSRRCVHMHTQMYCSNMHNMCSMHVQHVHVYSNHGVAWL